MSDVKLRNLIVSDLPDVLSADMACFPDCYWVKEDFEDVLYQKNCVGIVACNGDVIVGYAIFKHEKDETHIVNLAVIEPYRKSGIGRMLVKRACRSSERGLTRSVVARVREKNMFAQKFFSKCGFRAESVLRDFYGVDGKFTEDAYSFRYLPQKSEHSSPMFESIMNRMTSKIFSDDY